jgi:hypothetical protein
MNLQSLFAVFLLVVSVMAKPPKRDKNQVG